MLFFPISMCLPSVSNPTGLPISSVVDMDLKTVSMAFLVACGKTELQDAKQQYSEKIDRAFRKLVKAQENLVLLDKNVKKVLDMADVLQSIDFLTEFLEGFIGQIAEFAENLQELSRKMDAVKNENLNWEKSDQTEDAEAVTGVKDEFSEKLKRDFRDLTEAVNFFVKSTNTYVKNHNRKIEEILEMSSA